MPYIAPEQRQTIESFLSPLLGFGLDEGQLNYVITRLVHRFMYDRGESYASYNAAIGVLECAKLELYRRQVAPYEDKKIEENGDV